MNEKPIPDKRSRNWVSEKWFDYQRPYIKVMFDELISELEKETPNRTLRTIKLQREKEAAMSKGLEKYKSIMASMVQPMLSRLLLLWGKLEAANAGTIATIHIQIYKLRAGSFPQSLGQLEEELGVNIGTDPFSGNPFIYRKTETGYILYSVGSNGIDDGGRTEDDDPDADDIVLSRHMS